MRRVGLSDLWGGPGGYHRQAHSAVHCGIHQGQSWPQPPFRRRDRLESRSAGRIACPTLLCLGLLLAGSLFAQQDAINPVRPHAPILWRPYEPVTVPPVRLANSSRLADLIRAGNLYLTVRDAIALALENNVDIELQRYDASGWRLERAQAGGALPGVPSGSAQSSSVASGQGVLGSQAAAGVKTGGGGSSSGAGSNTTISQVGTVAQTYDPAIQEATTFGHRTVPSSDSVQSVTSVLIQGQRSYSASYQQGFVYGGSASVSYTDHYQNENAPTDVTNPSVFPTLSISIQQNLLQGFGVAVNTKDIRVAKINVGISDLNFKTQVMRTVSSVLGSYYALVADHEDLRAKRGALATARNFLDETGRRLELGAAAPLDVTTAKNQVAIAEQAEVNSLAAIRQQELQLKGLISRTGLGDPLVESAQIVPLDHLAIPAEDDLPPVKDLVKKALANRPDLEAEKENLNATEVSNLATVNGLLPTAVVFATKSNAGAAGTPQIVRTPFGSYTADPYFVGGIGKSLGQVFRNDFPSQSGGIYASVQIYDRVAEADHAIDQLSYRQQQLGAAKDFNQAQVDVMNSVVALRQARARYEAAVESRVLEQELYEAEQKKFSVGESTTFNVIQQQRDLTNAQSAELGALVSYENARIGLDQTTGATLEANHVSLTEALSGKVAQPSQLPATLPQ